MNNVHIFIDGQAREDTIKVVEENIKEFPKLNKVRMNLLVEEAEFNYELNGLYFKITQKVGDYARDSDKILKNIINLIKLQDIIDADIESDGEYFVMNL